MRIQNAAVLLNFVAFELAASDVCFQVTHMSGVYADARHASNPEEVIHQCFVPM